MAQQLAGCMETVRSRRGTKSTVLRAAATDTAVYCARARFLDGSIYLFGNMGSPDRECSPRLPPALTCCELQNVASSIYTTGHAIGLPTGAHDEKRPMRRQPTSMWPGCKLAGTIRVRHNGPELSRRHKSVPFCFQLLCNSL